MQILVELNTPEHLTGVDALAIIAFEEETASELPGVAADAIAEMRESAEWTGKLYETAVLHRPSGLAAKRLIFVGGGKRPKFTSVEARRAAGALVRLAKTKNYRRVALLLPHPAAEMVAAAAEGALLGNWEPDKYKTDPKKTEKAVDSLTILASPDMRDAAERGRIVAEAQNLTRDLANEPANLLTPADLMTHARRVASEQSLDIEVLDRAAMTKLGMGALLGVAQGSDNPPFLISLHYRPDAPASPDKLTLVGKGVTFDTGGISIKSADGMEKMKYDMSGAAAVLGAMQAIAQLKPAVAVSAYIATVENMLNGNAQRPGDIVTSLAGKTIEVINTDAEGRLILADALTYAIRNGATHLIDAATLTGAIGVALGHYNIGAFTNDENLLHRLLAASRTAGEKTWQMPMDEEYKDYLKSAFADLPNVGGRPGGSITAAWFLREFADPVPWVHLDIAATAWLDDAKPWLSKGPTGVCVRTFVALALQWASNPA